MTTDEPAPTNPDVPTDEVLAASDQVALHRARVARAMRRGRLRRRILPKVAAVTAVLATLAIADGLVQAAVPRPAAIAPAPARVLGPSATAQALAQVSKTLAADQQALAALEQTQAQLARGAEGADGGTSVSGASAPGISLPSLSSVAPLPSISTPAPVPTVTTGASVVVP